MTHLTKGEQTKAYILQKAVELFNTNGYANTSISDVMAATGLKKGGIYNHFTNKQELALQAFDYAFKLVRDRIRSAVSAHGNESGMSTSRLQSIVQVYRNMVENPPVPGGCPLLNAAIETDDANADPQLRKKVKTAMDYCRKLVRETIRQGISGGDIKPGVDPAKASTIILSLLEGAIMMSKLYRDSTYMNHASEHLQNYFETIAND